MADNDHKISEFCKVTSVDSSRARQYLESAGWDFNLAMSTYYEESDEVDEADMPEDREQPLLRNVAPAIAASSTSSTSRIATLSSLIQSDDNSDEEEGQAFYAGGSVRSGQQVLGPGKRNAGPHIVKEMFKAAKSHGAEVVDPTDSSTSSAQVIAFRGTGHILGNTMDGNEVVPNEEGQRDRQETTDICLKAWQTGFTVDNGPLRNYTDTQNKDFLAAIQNGEIPEELVRKTRGEVHLNIEDHSHEDYRPSIPSLQAFTGAGHRLGSPTPVVAGLQSQPEGQKNETEAQKMLTVDDSQPVTSLQIRLADGSRLVLKLNHTHTVGDIRRYLVIARPEYGASVFSLMTSYPPQEITEDNATVKEANLLNSVIVQKLN